MKKILISGIVLTALLVPTTASASYTSYEHANKTMNSRNCHANLLKPYLKRMAKLMKPYGIDPTLKGNQLVVIIKSSKTITKPHQEAIVDTIIQSANLYAKADGTRLLTNVKEV